ncbi:MAG: ATP-dependent protease ATPase subunit HslU [Planctomycetaceae bacterium]|nr:ATP-dependent protease ATPase subunit HslU [Planctomycetaceae bacterium]
MSEPLPLLAASDLTPGRIVELLDQYIIGQAAAKRSVAVAVRNRWRRQQLNDDLRQEVNPKNILMIGPTGVGKTEIARRLAKITGAPFIKVEATKFTEVGYYGRDVESMIRELVENAIVLVKKELQIQNESTANSRCEDRLLDLLCGPPPHSIHSSHSARHETASAVEVDEEVGDAESGHSESSSRTTESDSYTKLRAKMLSKLRAGQLEDKVVEFRIEQKSSPMVFGALGGDHMDRDMQSMLEKFMPKSSKTKKTSIKEARKVVFEQEFEKLLDEDQVNSQAISLAENLGIIFLDEIDKLVASEGKGADVSRQGVQRDLLPLVEGTIVNTRYGQVRTDHILFVAAGAFHKHQPSDLMPELQGRFPIRVELSNLIEDDYVRILAEPSSSLTRQYAALLETEGVRLEFTSDGIRQIARHAFQLNQTTQNIGARRLHTLLERILEEISFTAPSLRGQLTKIDAVYVDSRLKDLLADQDLSRFIL